MKQSTRNQYRKLLSQLKRWSISELNQSDIAKLTQGNIDDYEIYLIDDRQLSPRSINNHRQAINRYYTSLGVDIRLSLRSISVGKKVVETISQDLAELIIEKSPRFFQPILEKIYFDLVPPGQVIKCFPSPRGKHISLQAVNNQIAAITDGLGITKRVRASTLRQSGIVHQLEQYGPAVVMGKTGLSPLTIERYLRCTNNGR
jgi:site-specific recombinase XerD